jgi:putative ABC transport system permease protein
MPGVNIGQAQREMENIAACLRQAYPKVNGNLLIGVNVVSLQEQILGEVRQALQGHRAAVGSLLLITCADVANLMRAHTAGRRREVVLRLASGASSWRLIR